MFFSTSCFCLLRKMKVWASSWEVSRNLAICFFGPCMWFHSEWADTQSGGWIRTLTESEKSAPHWTLFSQLTEAVLLENAEPANQVSKASRFTYIRPLTTSYRVALAETLSSVQLSWEVDGKGGQVLILGDLNTSREYKYESYRIVFCGCP